METARIRSLQHTIILHSGKSLLSVMAFLYVGIVCGCYTRWTFHVAPLVSDNGSALSRCCVMTRPHVVGWLSGLCRGTRPGALEPEKGRVYKCRISDWNVSWCYALATRVCAHHVITKTLPQRNQ